MKNRKISLLITIILVFSMAIGMAGLTFASNFEPVSISAYLGGGYTGYDTVHTNNIMDVVVDSSDGSCNLRTGPGMGYSVIMPVYNGTTLNVTAVSKNSSDGLVWGQTTYNGYSGWISIMLTKVTTIENSSRAEYDVIVDQDENICLRKGPGTEYDPLLYPKDGQVLRIVQTSTNGFDGRPWGKTTINGTTGWVSLDWTTRLYSGTYNKSTDIVYFNNIYYAVVDSSDGYANLRSGPGMNYGTIMQIYNGSDLTISAVANNGSDGLVWGQTYYNGYSGWVCMTPTKINSIENASRAEYRATVFKSENIALRKGPGTEYSLIDSNIPNNTVLYITETAINSFDGRPWGKTTYNGWSGWVSLDWTIR